MEDHPKSSGQFFTVSIAAIKNILTLNGGAVELAAYVVIRRGSGRHTSTRWTENAIRDRLSISYKLAQITCSWLCEHRLIERCNPVSNNGESPSHDTTRHKWRTPKHRDDQLVYLPNSLVDGLSRSPNKPLERLLEKVELDIRSGIFRPAAQVDAIAILLALYGRQDVLMYGGIDPKVWYREWIPTDRNDLPACHELSETGFLLEQIERCNSHFSNDFINETLFYITDSTKRHRRAMLALKNLRNLGFTYEVLQIWNSNPLEFQHANLLYPLYVFSEGARNSDEPVLHDVINRVAIYQYNAYYDSSLVFDSSGELILNKGHIFRYITSADNEAFPISSLRLRYRAHDRDTGSGFAAQLQMVEEWKEAIKNLLPNPFENLWPNF